MNGTLTATVLVLLWGTVLARVPTLWRDAQQRALWATLATLALAKTAATPGVNALLGDLVRQPQTLPHLIGVATAYFLLRFISLITDFAAARPRAARCQLLLAGTVMALLIVLMNATPGGIRTRGAELTSTAAEPAATAYWVVLNGYLGTVLGVATVLFWGISRSATSGPLRHGLRAIATGTLLVALYAALKTGLIVAQGFSPAMSFGAIEPVANGLRAVGTILAVIGAAVPAGGKLASIIGSYRALWALRPLWRVMRKTFPDVILFSRRRALVELAGVDDVQLRLYRRVIEIRDGMLTLRGYLPAGTIADARAFVGDRPALVEACGIAFSLRRHGSGLQPVVDGDRWAEVGGEITDEVAWLGAVAAAFRRREPALFARRRDATVAD
ncbi:MAB_1171c family putative transporter [Actinoplanes sp. NPDC049118]|uniref:MAB_1171c family putative transporter n=1 Tax=Actinoplanes sp. NPDC049118 TaxID=3155769 RepID=UPI00340316E9